jgi:hypothetical protein
MDIDKTPMNMAITAKYHDDLFNEAQTFSLDGNSMPVLVNGRINAFKGFSLIHSERIPRVRLAQCRVQSRADVSCSCRSKFREDLGQEQDVTGHLERLGNGCGHTSR